MTIDQRLQKTHTRVYTDNDNAIQTRGDHENVKHEKNSKNFTSPNRQQTIDVIRAIPMTLPHTHIKKFESDRISLLFHVVCASYVE